MFRLPFTHNGRNLEVRTETLAGNITILVFEDERRIYVGASIKLEVAVDAEIGGSAVDPVLTAMEAVRDDFIRVESMNHR